MSHITRWLGSTNPQNVAGSATFTAGGQSVTVSLGCFDDARAIDKVIEAGCKAAAAQARAASLALLRGAANTLESDCA